METICSSCNSPCGPFTCCEKCKVIWFCENYEKCSINKAKHANQCNGDCQHGTKQQLRFKVGDEVIIGHSVNGSYAHHDGTVSEIWPHSSLNSAYGIFVRDLNCVVNVDIDHSDTICSKDFDVGDIKKLIHFHLKRGHEMKTIVNILEDNPQLFTDWTYWWPYLLHNCGIYGNLQGTIHLIKECGVDPFIIDSKGRNILHLGILNKRLSYIEYLMCPTHTSKPTPDDMLYYLPQMATHVDDDGRNAVHHCVLTGLFTQFKAFMFDNFISVKSYRNVFVQQDSKGRTALEYAILFKKSDFIELLAPHTIEAKFAFCTEELLKQNSVNPGQLLDYFKKHLNIVGMTVGNVSIDETQQAGLLCISSFCVSNAIYDCIEWLINGTWQMHLRFGFSSPAAFYSKNMSQVLNGSELEQAEFELFKHPKKIKNFDRNLILLALKDDFNDLIRHWNGTESFGQYIMNYMQDFDPRFTNKTTFRLRAANEYLVRLPRNYGTELYHLYIAHQVFGNRHIFPKHVNILRFFLSKHTPSTSFWSIVTDIRSQLKWFIMYYPDRFAERLTDCKELFEIACQLEWYADSVTHHPYNKTLTIREFLVFLCGTLDALREYEILVPFGSKDIPRCEINGFNLIEVAIKYGSNGILRECMLPEGGCLKASADRTLGYIRLAVENGHQVIANEMVNYYGTCMTLAVHPELMRQYYTMTSSAVIVKLITNAVLMFQRMVRVGLARRKFWPLIDEFNAFKHVWQAVIVKLRALKSGAVPIVSWASIKREYDMVADDTDAEIISGLFYKVGVASNDEEVVSSPAAIATKAPLLRETADFDRDQQVEDVPFDSQVPLENIELSISAVKWFADADSVHRELFSKRLVQLADGQRSYALSKRLQGSSYPMFETKLDRGFRILWTKVTRNNRESILVWFVTHHDNISKYVRRINDSCLRLSRQLIVLDQHGAEASVVLDETDVLLDPTGNAPLKIYATNKTDLAHATSLVKWTPPLLLSAKQQSVNAESGTVLLLGRSGTGKTICLCDRIIRDQNCRTTPLKQLFVCRSNRLCEFVKNYQQQYCDHELSQNIDFMTLSAFTAHMSALIAAECGASCRSFSLGDKVDFHRFANTIYPEIKKKCNLTASVVWLHIRSFIKGSVEAVKERRPLISSEYTDISVFGADRCRLSVSDRKELFTLYLRYESVLKTQRLWDDADYTLDLLTRSKLEPLSTQYDKVYVDEVQDNIQAEIVLYFLAAGMITQSLFLAGDPAQSVVEGVDFRFEDVRGIVYKLSGSKYSINRPMKLFVNYRSHSGVLDCAAAILSKMFTMFPAAANVLPKDVGLFKGPRPACCQVDGMEGLAKLLTKNERLVILCDDSTVETLTATLKTFQIKNIVIGIRAAKGLEFQDVVLLDFFASIPEKDQAVWKGLISSSNTQPSSNHPQVELQLKLLYTAVTRSCNRLLFVETGKTQLSSVMFRWLVEANLAEAYNAANESTVLMTSDEWRIQGIEFALSAEGENTVQYLNNAAQCFMNQTGDKENELLSRTFMQLFLFNSTKSTLSHSGKLGDALENVVKNICAEGLKYGFVYEVKFLLEVLSEKVDNPAMFKRYVKSLL